MDIQTIIDTAVAANATTLAAAEAASVFRDGLKTAYRVRVNLTPAQRSLLQKYVSFPVVFVGGRTISNDHPVLCAIRDLCRDVYEAECKISSTSERTLVVGASAREIRKYNSNSFIHYHIHGKENKDYDRIVRPALMAISMMLKAKAPKKDKKVFLPPVDDEARLEPRGVVKRYNTIEALIADWVNSQRLPSNIHTEYCEANTLVFEDSIYNFNAKMLCEVFDKTKAQIAYGYAMLPLKLLYPDLPKNELYHFNTTGNRASMTIVNGYSNGYEHNLDNWKTILSSPVITCGKTTLVVEIISLVGPGCVFKIYRFKFPETIVRSIDIPENFRYVKVLDLMGCTNKTTGKVSYPLKYLSVFEDEYNDLLNYLLGLDMKSITMPTAITYVRRRMGGVSLITKDLVEKWNLQKRDVVKLALIAVIQAYIILGEADNIRKNCGIGDFAEKFKALFRQGLRSVFLPVALCLEWIMAGHLEDKLVLYPNMTKFQRVNVCTPFLCKTRDVPVDDMIEAGLYCDFENCLEMPDCEVCADMHGKMGEQVVKCVPGRVQEIDLIMTDEMIGKLKTYLIDNDKDPVGLKTVKERAQKAMPQSAFKRTVRVHYFTAGPGCGKTYLIRKLATQKDLVLAPFTKLKPDYEGLTNDAGEKYNLLFKTTHRAMESRGCVRIFVDEFTSLPYEYLACIAEVNGAEEIFLVGDDKQTRVIEPDEGLYIGNHINLDKLDMHELTVNFRNPKDVVALLKEKYGYCMTAKSITRSFKIIKPEEVPVEGTALRMSFTKASAETNIANDSNTYEPIREAPLIAQSCFVQI